nr:MAG TPA: hypothetical protein [Bacteriophage sp.]
MPIFCFNRHLKILLTITYDFCAGQFNLNCPDYYFAVLSNDESRREPKAAVVEVVARRSIAADNANGVRVVLVTGPLPLIRIIGSWIAVSVSSIHNSFRVISKITISCIVSLSTLGLRSCTICSRNRRVTIKSIFSFR